MSEDAAYRLFERNFHDEKHCSSECQMLQKKGCNAGLLLHAFSR